MKRIREIIDFCQEYASVAATPGVSPKTSPISLNQRTQAKKRKNIRIAQGSGLGWPNYRRLNESHVGYKVLIDTETETVLGAHLVGPHAGELINLFALAMKHHIPLKDLQELPWAYPTDSADIKYMLG